LQEFHRQAQILNRYVIAELLTSDAMVSTLRRELRRLFYGIRTSDEELKVLLSNEVIKRDTLDGELPKAAKTLVKKASTALAKKQQAKPEPLIDK
jgi:hypothetical protein